LKVTLKVFKTALQKTLSEQHQNITGLSDFLVFCGKFPLTALENWGKGWRCKSK